MQLFFLNYLSSWRREIPKMEASGLYKEYKKEKALMNGVGLFEEKLCFNITIEVKLRLEKAKKFNKNNNKKMRNH